MGIGPGDAGRLTYWQYTALRHEWNERHKDPDAADAGEPVEPPTAAHVKASQEELYALGIAGKAG